MRILRNIFLLLITSLSLVSCYNVNQMKPYLCKIHYLKQDMYVCEVQYRYPGGGPDQYFIRDPHIFGGTCEDSMYSLAYRTKPAVWKHGHGDYRNREWFVAHLRKGTPYFINQSYDAPYIGEESPDDSTGINWVKITVAGGQYQGLQAQWNWFDPTREIDRPYYFPAMRTGNQCGLVAGRWNR
jgi:hypothetical protein